MDRSKDKMNTGLTALLPQNPLSTEATRHNGKRLAMAAGGIALSLAVAGCQMSNPFAPPTASTGQPASEAQQTQADPDAPKPTFSQFTDVPIPANAEMDLKKTIILGAEEGWIGRLAINAGHSMGDMYAFYDREMSKFGWTKVTVVRSQISTLTFSRSGRIATITLQPTGSKATEVDFTVSPERQTAKSG